MDHARGTSAGPAPRRVHLLTASLAVAVFFGFGLLVFAIAIVLPEMMAELGWTDAAISAGLTIGLLGAGLVAPAVGTLIDRVGGRTPMVLGAVVTSMGMWAWSLVTTYTAYVLTWLVLGAGMSLILYEAAFTTMVRHAPARRRQGLFVISLLGAVSSTAFLPTIDLLVRSSGWRQALVVLALANLTIVTPLLAIGVPRRGAVLAPGPSVSIADGADRGASGASGAVLAGPPASGAPHARETSMFRDARLRRIGIATLLGDAPAYSVSVAIVPYLIVSGRSTSFAALTGGLVGVAKLLGRLGAGLLVTRVSSHALLVSGYVLVGVGLAIPLLPVDGALDVAMAVGFGLGSGVQTVMRPLYVSDLYGTAGFGRTFGRISRIGRMSMALAPALVGLSVTGTGGYTVAWTTMALGSLLAARVLPRGEDAAVAVSR